MTRRLEFMNVRKSKGFQFLLLNQRINCFYTGHILKIQHSQRVSKAEAGIVLTFVEILLYDYKF